MYTVAWIFGAYGYRLATTTAMARTGYVGQVGEVDLPWYLMGTRFYVPWLRCFASPDPASPFDAGGCHRYAYCGGDPINRIDPGGNAWWHWLGGALGVVGAVVATAVTFGAATPVITGALLGLVADAVSVSVAVGSTAAMELGNESLGGILGWVALGAGVASAGAGVASQVIAKSTRDVGRAAQGGIKGGIMGSLGRPSSLEGPLASGNNVQTHMFRERGNRLVRYLTGDGLADLPALTSTNRITATNAGGFRVEPKDMAWSNGHGGTIIGFDSRVQIQHIDEVVRREAASNPKRVVNVFLGGHGDPVGRNWVKPSPGKGTGTVFDPQQVDTLSRNVRDMLAPSLRHDFSNVRIQDVERLSGADAMAIMGHDDSINVLGMCFSIADVKANKVRVSTSASGRLPTYTVYDRPYGAV